MKNTPMMLKIFLNVLLYLFYLVMISIAFSLLFPLVMQALGKEILDPTVVENIALFNKIQIFIAILVLLISLVFRKYFYISLKSSETIKIVKSYTSVKKEADFSHIPHAEKKEKKITMEDNSDDEIKIYVEKEIK